MPDRLLPEFRVIAFPRAAIPKAPGNNSFSQADDLGALMKKAAVDDRGRGVARDLMTLTLVCDHRILYGADGARFLARVRELLERPLALAL